MRTIALFLVCLGGLVGCGERSNAPSDSDFQIRHLPALTQSQSKQLKRALALVADLDLRLALAASQKTGIGNHPSAIDVSDLVLDCHFDYQTGTASGSEAYLKLSGERCPCRLEEKLTYSKRETIETVNYETTNIHPIYSSVTKISTRYHQMASDSGSWSALLEGTYTFEEYGQVQVRKISRMTNRGAVDVKATLEFSDFTAEAVTRIAAGSYDREVFALNGRNTPREGPEPENLSRLQVMNPMLVVSLIQQ